MKILITDLDGTLIQTRSGAKFAKGPWDWTLTPGIITALQSYQPDLVHIVSNQAGIGRGLVKESDWLSKVGRVIEAIKKEVHTEISYDYCISINPDDPKRKPNPGMITDFLKKYQGTDYKVLMIGDASGLSNTDWKAAYNAGIPYLDINTFLKLYNV